MYRWLMTHDGGISAETPPRLCSVCVGMPIDGPASMPYAAP